MKSEDQTKVEKKVYAKPQVMEIQLKAGEAVLATCKNQANFDLCRGAGDISCIGDTFRS